MAKICLQAFAENHTPAEAGTVTASRPPSSDDAELHLLRRSRQLNRHLCAVRLDELTTLSWDMRLTLSCLQGVVNRSQPELYLIHDRYDELWLDWLRQRGDIDRVEWLSVRETFDHFLPRIACMFVTDPSIPATVNVATMLAGACNGLVTTPETRKQYNLPAGSNAVALQGGLDLASMGWKKDLEAYRWAFQTLDAQLSRQAIAILYPDEVVCRDYLVEFRIPIFWVSGQDAVRYNPAAIPDKEKEFAREILMKWPPNIPCLGWPSAGEEKEWGLGEGPGMQLISECAKFEVCTAYDGYSPTVGNLSVHSGTRAQLTQSTFPIHLDSNKVYCTFIRSDGDGMNFLRHYYRKLFDDPDHGKVPLGWQLGPMITDLMPNLADYYYQHAAPGDCFVNALTGIGYIWEEYYAKSYPAAQQPEILRNYRKLSALYRKRIDASVTCTGDEMCPEVLHNLVGDCGFRAVFANYVRTPQTTLKNMTSEAARMVVFRDLMDSASGWLSKGMDFTTYSQRETEINMATNIREWTPRSRPAFLYFSLNNWLREMDILSMIVDRLGPEYKVVRPDQQAELYAQHHRGQSPSAEGDSSKTRN